MGKNFKTVARPSGSTIFTNNWIHWLAACACAASLIGFAYIVCGGPVFETNDDVGMAMISSGNCIVDRPDEHLVYSSFVLGKLLNIAYGVTQQIPWYGLMLAGFQFLALIIIARIFLAKGKGDRGLAIAIVALFLAALRPVILMQFTSTAALVAIAGALLLLVAVEKSKSLSWRSLVPVTLLFLIAALIRSDSAKLIIILTGFASVARFWQTPKSPKFIGMLSALVVALSLVFSLDVLTFAYYAKDRWKEFHHLNAYRAPLMVKHFDTSDERVKDAVKLVGWTPYDLHLFESWYILDEQTYSIEKVRTVLERTPRVNNVSWTELKDQWEKIFLDWTVVPMLISIGVLAACVSRERISFFSRVGLISSVAAMMCALMLLMHLPPRVFVVMLSFLIVVLTYYSSPHLLNSSGGTRFWPAVILLSCTLMPSAVLLSNYCQQIEGKNAHLREVVRELKPNSKKLFVSWAGSFPFGLIKPFTNMNDYLNGFQLVGIGSNGRSPHVMDRLRQFGINDLMMQLDKPGVFVLSSELINNIIETFLKVHRNKNVRFETVFRDEMLDLQVNRVVSGAPEQEVPPLVPRSSDIYLAIQKWSAKKGTLVGTRSGIASYECRIYEKPKFLTRGLAIDPKSLSSFAIEVQVDPWQVCDGTLTLRLGDEEDPKSVSYSKKLITDDKLHTYRFDLSKLKSKIERVSFDLSFVQQAAKTKFSIGRIAFVNDDRLDIQNLTQ